MNSSGTKAFARFVSLKRNPFLGFLNNSQVKEKRRDAETVVAFLILEDRKGDLFIAGIWANYGTSHRKTAAVTFKT